MKYETSAVTQIVGCISKIFTACVFIKIISVLHSAFKVYAVLRHQDPLSAKSLQIKTILIVAVLKHITNYIIYVLRCQQLQS